MLINTIFRRIPDPPEGGGGTPASYRSMSEIEEAARLEREKGGGGIEGGDGGKKVPVLPTGTAPEGKKFDADGITLIDDPDYKKPETVVIPPGKKLDVDGKTLIDDPNYKPLPVGKMYDKDGKTLIDDPDYKAEEEVEEDFWAEVQKHTGRDIKVEYPEGIEPASVEGAALREGAVIEHAIGTWEHNLQERYPRAYAYMMHHMDGGSDEDFMNNERGMALPERVTVESSVDVQTTLIKQDLLAKGVDPDIIDAQVAADIKKGVAKDKAIKIYDKVEKDRKDELASIQQRRVDNQAKLDNIIKVMTNKVEKVLPDLGFVIPETEKKAFQDYFLNNMQYDQRDGTFHIVLPVKEEDLKTHMEAMFVQFKKADLSKIVQKKAQTLAAQRLRVQADKTKTATPNQSNTNNDGKKFVPLGEMGVKS